jgi:predicted Zn-dependent peptidase
MRLDGGSEVPAQRRGAGTGFEHILVDGQLRIGASSQAGLAGTINHYEYLGASLAGLDELFAAAKGLAPADVAEISDRHLGPREVIEGT